MSLADSWSVYLAVYIGLTLGYLWYRFILLFIADLRTTKNARGSYTGDLLSVLIPFYNEDVPLLQRTISSVLAAAGNKEVIVIDDGSPNRAASQMVKQTFGDAVTLVRYEGNRGKRQAQAAGYAHVNGTFLITVDSDTVIAPDALVRLVEPLCADPAVAATTGNVRVLNVDENMLTRMIASRYWNAFNIERKSLSSFGVVTCCSGVLSAYRTSVTDTLLAQYIHQRFLGVECTYGDDRHLTNLVLREGHKVLYVEDAVCYTAAPTTLRTFIRQQLRWKKSFLRESVISLSFAFRHSLLLPIEVLLNLLIPFLSLGVRLSIIAGILVYPPLLLPFIASVITVAVLRNFFLFFEDKKLALYSVPYAFIHELILFWLYFVALFTLRERSWGTR